MLLSQPVSAHPDLLASKLSRKKSKRTNCRRILSEIPSLHLDLIDVTIRAAGSLLLPGLTILKGWVRVLASRGRIYSAANV